MEAIDGPARLSMATRSAIDGPAGPVVAGDHLRPDSPPHDKPYFGDTKQDLFGFLDLDLITV